MEKIDIDAVVRQRAPQYYRRIPGWLIRGAERFICQDRLNDILANAGDRRDADFCRSVLEYLDVGYELRGRGNLPAPGPDSRVIFTCNHPLGALDGIIIIDMLSAIYGSGIKFIVNDLLYAVEPLRGVFLPVNKHGAQSRDAARAVDDAMRGDKPVIIFPAGLCSRASWGGTVADLEWNKMFVNMAIRHRRDIIPLHFDGRNSMSFYLSAKLRSTLGIKFNIEMLHLPREIFKSLHKRYTVTAGPRISYTQLAGGTSARATAARLRALTYSLSETSRHARTNNPTG